MRVRRVLAGLFVAVVPLGCSFTPNHFVKYLYRLKDDQGLLITTSPELLGEMSRMLWTGPPSGRADISVAVLLKNTLTDHSFQVNETEIQLLDPQGVNGRCTFSDPGRKGATRLAPEEIIEVDCSYSGKVSEELSPNSVRIPFVRDDGKSGVVEVEALSGIGIYPKEEPRANFGWWTTLSNFSHNSELTGWMDERSRRPSVLQRQCNLAIEARLYSQPYRNILVAAFSSRENDTATIAIDEARFDWGEDNQKPLSFLKPSDQSELEVGGGNVSVLALAFPDKAAFANRRELRVRLPIRTRDGVCGATIKMINPNPNGVPAKDLVVQEWPSMRINFSAGPALSRSGDLKALGGLGQEFALGLGGGASRHNFGVNFGYERWTENDGNALLPVFGKPTSLSGVLFADFSYDLRFYQDRHVMLTASAGPRVADFQVSKQDDVPATSSPALGLVTQLKTDLWFKRDRMSLNPIDFSVFVALQNYWIAFGGVEGVSAHGNTQSLIFGFSVHNAIPEKPPQP